MTSVIASLMIIKNSVIVPRMSKMPLSRNSVQLQYTIFQDAKILYRNLLKRNTGRSYECQLFSQLSSRFLSLSCKRQRLAKTIVNIIVSFCINDVMNVDWWFGKMLLNFNVVIRQYWIDLTIHQMAKRRQTIKHIHIYTIRYINDVNWQLKRLGTFNQNWLINAATSESA